MNRITGIDIFRGMAIVFMVIFHICYDLNYFKFTAIPLYSSGFWINFRLLIVNMFLITAGISLALVHKEGICWHSVKNRIIQLGLASVAISMATYMVFPRSWIYFGVIHFILVASIVGLLFVSYPKVSLGLSIAILIGYFFFHFNMHPVFEKIAPALHLPMRYTEDLVPFIPWFAATLFGIATVGFDWHLKVFSNSFFEAKTKAHNTLALIGKKALPIYLLHQPLIFGTVYVVHLFFQV